MKLQMQMFFGLMLLSLAAQANTERKDHFAGIQKGQLICVVSSDDCTRYRYDQVKQVVPVVAGETKTFTEGKWWVSVTLNAQGSSSISATEVQNVSENLPVPVLASFTQDSVKLGLLLGDVAVTCMHFNPEQVPFK